VGVCEDAGGVAEGVARWLAAGMVRLLLLLLRGCGRRQNLICGWRFGVERRAASDCFERMARNLGWMAAEFVRLPGYTRENIEKPGGVGRARNFLEGKSAEKA